MYESDVILTACNIFGSNLLINGKLINTCFSILSCLWPNVLPGVTDKVPSSMLRRQYCKDTYCRIFSVFLSNSRVLLRVYI